MAKIAKADDVALWILNKAKSMGLSICPMKLQKILYYCQGYNIGMTSEPLFEEDIEAWQHGPVVPFIYRKYKKFGANPITSFDITIEAPREFAGIISAVLQDKGKLSASELRNATHEELPYKKTDENKAISKELMEEYFSPLFWDADEEDSYQPSFDSLEEEDRYFKEGLIKKGYDAIFEECHRHLATLKASVLADIMSKIK